MIDDLERARRLPQKPPCAASKGASWYLFFLFYFFFDICLRPAAPSACRGGDLSVSACPRGLGAVWPFGRVLPHGRLALLVRLAAGRRHGGLRAVVLCGGGAIVVGAFMPRHSGSPSHSTLHSSTPACYQAPLVILLVSLFIVTSSCTRTHREVDLRMDIWLSGRAMWKRRSRSGDCRCSALVVSRRFSPVSRPTYSIVLLAVGDFFFF